MNTKVKNAKHTYIWLLLVLCISIFLFASPASAESQLPAPQNLHCTAKTADSITMAWDSVSGASYYRFYLNGSFLTTVSGTSYACTGLTQNTVYGFKVAAVSGEEILGQYSNHVYIRTHKEPLTAPQNLHASAKTSNSITMAWSAVSGASYYRFYRDGVYVSNVYSTSYSSKGLTANTVYGFMVCAVNSTGTLGQYSSHVYVRTHNEPLAAPQNLHASTKSYNSITLAWNSVPRHSILPYL